MSATKQMKFFNNLVKINPEITVGRAGMIWNLAKEYHAWKMKNRVDHCKKGQVINFVV